MFLETKLNKKEKKLFLNLFKFKLITVKANELILFISLELINYKRLILFIEIR